MWDHEPHLTTLDEHGDDAPPLRTLELLRDSLILMGRRPLVALGLPVLGCVVGTVGARELGFTVTPLDMIVFEGGWSGFWLGADTFLIAPIVAFAWVLLSQPEAERVVSDVQAVRTQIHAFLVGTLVVIGACLGTAYTVVAGLGLGLALGLAVPTIVTGAEDTSHAIRRSVRSSLARLGPLVSAWLLAQLCVLAIAAGGQLVFEEALGLAYRLPPRARELLLGGLVELLSGASWGASLAISVTASRQLGGEKGRLDPEDWIEVFR